MVNSQKEHITLYAVEFPKTEMTCTFSQCSPKPYSTLIFGQFCVKNLFEELLRCVTKMNGNQALALPTTDVDIPTRCLCLR